MMVRKSLRSNLFVKVWSSYPKQEEICHCYCYSVQPENYRIFHTYYNKGMAHLEIYQLHFESLHSNCSLILHLDLTAVLILRSIGKRTMTAEG
jgi:hypothetical protein